MSLPQPWLEWIDKFLEENKDILNKFDVDSRAKVVKLLVNYGKTPLEEAIARLKSEESSCKKREKPE